MRWSDRLYRLVLRIYPAEFRDEYAREMAQAFHDRASDDGRARIWLDLATDVARTAPKEHAHVLLDDLRYAGRMMRRAPTFTAAVVFTVALAIAANTAIFSVVNAVIVRPLPFADPGRLVQVAEKNDKLNLPTFGASALNFLSWKEQTQALDGMSAIGFASFNLSGSGEPEQFTGTKISASLLPTLGLQPVAGYAFSEGDDKPGAPPVAMISEGVWRRRFGGDSSIVGRTLTLNGVDTRIVGIAPAALAVLTGGDIWVPIAIDPGRELRLNHVIVVVARLKRGTTLRQAQAEMDTVSSRVGQTYPEVKDWGIRLVAFDRWLIADQLRTALLVLLAAVGFVLLVACANIANLLLARAAGRQKEIAIRTAMGASRSRLLRQLLVESVALSLVGGAIGTAGALWAVRAINAALPAGLLPIPTIAADAGVFAFAAAATIATGVLFGIVPAWQAARTDVNATLKQTGGGSTGGPRARLRNGLAAAELAIATVLLIGAGLLVQSLLHLQRARLGFDPDHVLTFQIALPPAKYPLQTKAPRFYRQLLESLASVPGVRGAAISSGIPLGNGNYTQSPFATTGKSVVPPDTAIPINWRQASPDYFRTMGIPLVRGRPFTDADDGNAQRVAIVSQGTARKFWGDHDPIGRELHRADGRSWTVVGVVGDVRDTTLTQEAASIYFSSAAGVWPLMDVVVRTQGTPESVLPSVRQKVHELDAELPLAGVRPMTAWIENSAAQPRLSAALLLVFAVVALLIAAIGIYGVMAYSVNQRTRELGLRMALGAQPGGVLRLVVGEGMIVGTAGIAAGLALGVGLGRAIESLVYGVTVRDPATFGAVGVALAIVALAACCIPARRAARVDPIVALRDE